MKKLLVLIFTLCASLAHANVPCTLPFNLQNNTIADATQVMANYNALVTCLGNAAIAGTNTDITAFTNAVTIPFRQSGANSVSTTVNTKLLQIYNSVDWGIKCDGATDDTTNFNNAITDISGFGGGILRLPTGTCIAEGIVMRSFVLLAGQGRHATVIQGRNTTTGNIISTLNFSALTGTNTIGGPFKWGLQDLTIDGNKAGRASGDALDFYGYDYVLENVDIRNAPGIGLYSEWSTSGTVPVASGGDGMDARLINVRVFSNGANGITWNGPHDSHFVNVLSYINTGMGMDFGQSGNFSAVGTLLNNVHNYGNGNWGIRTNTYLIGADITSESNTTGGIQVNTSSQGKLVASSVSVFSNVGPGLQLNGTSSVISVVVALNNSGGSGDGVQMIGNSNTIGNLAASGNSQSGLNIQGSGNLVVNGNFASNLSAVNFQSSTGANTVQLTNFQGAGNVLFGGTGAQPSDTVDISSTGVVLQYHQHPGSSNNTSALAGDVGEVISASVASGSAVALTSNTGANVTSISLTAGDWDISGDVYFLPAATTNITIMIGSVSQTSATFSTVPGQFSQVSYTPASGQVPGTNVAATQKTGPFQVTLSTTTTIFLVGQANFTVAGLSAYGQIRARRMR